MANEICSETAGPVMFSSHRGRRSGAGSSARAVDMDGSGHCQAAGSVWPFGAGVEAWQISPPLRLAVTRRT